MVHMTNWEIIAIDDGNKVLTIRKFRKDGKMPFKIGSKLILKTNGFFSKERYGQIEILDAEIKPLSKMTLKDARNGGYNTIQEYLDEQMEDFNSDCDLSTEMIFYRFKVLWMDADLVKQLRKKAIPQTTNYDVEII